MNTESLFQNKAKRIVNVALAGAGEFGATFSFQSMRNRYIDVPVIINRTVEKGVAAFVNAGVDEDRVAICDSAQSAKKNHALGKRVVVPKTEYVLALPIDVFVEATGSPEVGSSSAVMAIDNGWHVVMVSKEVDSVVGPELAAQAQAKGVVYTPGDGDQPSLLIGLMAWARTVGLTVVAAGKSSEYDFVYYPQKGVLVSNGAELPAGGLEGAWRLGDRPVQAVFEQRREMFAGFAHRAVPDLCEMAVVANATGMKPDHPVFHAPVARPVEIPDFLCPREMGGLLERPGTLDIINCLRRDDEASLGGGVFIIVACQDAETWRVLAGKGHPVSRNKRCAMLYRPAHLLGMETVTSVLSAAILGQSTGGAEVKPVCDLVGRAERDLSAGQVLDMGGHHHTIDGVAAELVDAMSIGAANPVPFYLMAHRRLRCDVRSGQLITAAMVELDESSILYRVRQNQDQRFFGH